LTETPCRWRLRFQDSRQREKGQSTKPKCTP
jgi:hypothetical protein